MGVCGLCRHAPTRSPISKTHFAQRQGGSRQSHRVPRRRWTAEQVKKMSDRIQNSSLLMNCVTNAVHVMDHEVDLEILVADTLWSASSVSHITAWLWKKSLNIWVKTETPHLLSSRLTFKRLQYFCLSFLPVSLASSAFRCAYCYFLNPARKMRPQAPKLPEFSFEKRLRTESNTPEPAPRPATDTKENAPPSAGINKHMCMKAVVSFLSDDWNSSRCSDFEIRSKSKMSSRGDPLRHSHVPVCHFFVF